jgi:hypothetical protein
MMHTRACSCLLALVLVACAAEAATTNEDPDLLGPGKSDIWELARPLVLGEPLTGTVSATAFELFAIDAALGDVLEIAVERTSGDFEPRTVLYGIGGSNVSHDQGSYAETAGGNRKSLTATASRHHVVVRANYYRGAGEFSLVVRCVGGPCAGDFGPGDDRIVHAGTCLERARECALTRLGSAAVTDVASAASLLNGCLAEQNVFGFDCAAACAVGEDATALCTKIAEALPFYADESDACRELANDCLEECNLREEYGSYLDEDDFEFWMNSEAICWNDVEWNGTCDDFARAHVHCGGTEHAVEESFDSCMAWCGAISGAWGSDIDEMCGPGCFDSVCTAIDDECRGSCGDDDSCWRSCVDAHPRQGDVFSWGCDDL